MSELTPKQQRLLEKAEKFSTSKEFASAESFLNLEDKVDTIAQNVDTKLNSLSEELKKKLESELVLEIDKEELKGDKGDQGEKGDKGDKGDKGEKGDTTIVEKVIEKTEVIIKERPIELVREIRIKELPDEISRKIRNLENEGKGIKANAAEIKTLQNRTQLLNQIVSSRQSSGGSQNLQQVTDEGSTTTNTITAGGFIGDGSGLTNLPLSDYLTEADYADIKRQGVVDRAETTFAFDGTNTFTLTSVGANWSYYRDGLKYTITGNKTVVIPGTPIAAGTWYIYIDDTIGTLSASQTVWTLLDTKVPIATINFNDSLTPKYWTSDERHSSLIDGYMQFYLHNVDGARSLNTPSLTGYIPDTDTNVAKTFAISAGTLVDQDIIHSLASLPDPDGTATDYVVWYRTGVSTWEWKLSNMPFLYNTSTNWIQYDNGGTPTDLTGGGGALRRWTNSYLLLTNKSGASRFVITPGRGVFTYLDAAKAESVSTFAWDGFPIAESVIVYQLTWSTLTSTSQGQCRLAAEPTLVNISTVTNNSSGAGTDHNTLSNLQGGTLGEYYHIHQGLTEVTK